MNGYDYQFKNLPERVNRELYYLGYSKLGVLDKEALQAFKNETQTIKGEIEKWNSKGQLFSLIDTYRQLFIRSNQIVHNHFCKYLQPFFSADEVDIHAASHIVKPFGLRSKFLCHQDSAIVEEPGAFALNAWMPLTDVGLLNGCLWVLPGSHILPNYTRYAGNNPFDSKQTQKELWKKLKPVYFKAGEVILFHRSLLHGSSKNFIPGYRIAVEAIVIPKNEQLIVYHRDEDTPKDKILMFKVDKDHFFVNDNPRGKLLKDMKNFEVKDWQSNSYALSTLQQYYPLFEERAAGLKLQKA